MPTIDDGPGYQRKVLPTYLALDTSGSMGKYEDLLNDTLMHIYDVMAVEPSVSEFIHLSVLSFNTEPHLVTGMTRFDDVTSLPTVTCGGLTNFGLLFDLLRDRIEADVAAISNAGARVLRPLVFLLTDGIPTDEPAGSWQSRLDRLVEKSWKPYPQIVTYGFSSASDAVLARIATAAAFAAESKEADSEALAKALKSMLRSMVASAKVQAVRVPTEVEGYRSLPLDYVDTM